MVNTKCTRFWIKELRLENWKLNHQDATVFCKSQWFKDQTKASKLYMIYRWLIVIFVFFGGIFYDMINDITYKQCKLSQLHCKLIWPVYLTNWNTTLLFLQSTLAAFLVTRHCICPKKSSNTMSAIHKAYWTLYNMSSGLAPIVTCMFWIFEYKPEIHDLDYVNLREHAVFTIIVLIDVLVCAHPMRLLHLYQVGALGLGYVTFSLIYFLFGGINRQDQPYIYDILDWNHFWQAAFVAIGTLVFECFVFFTLWTVNLARRKMASKFSCVENENAQENKV
ncbi:protein rolling stone-like [Neocloeon triangulifer]|uniref:protein rolling stone-like n=1 Tax=Neocloeon triangulifer TaxID=2078957 RepID=UPI00286ECB84|nr:protein rolling stone-like [Neocloeon triangulifer]